MSFLNKDSSNPLIKGFIIVIAVLLIVGGLYSFFGLNKQPFGKAKQQEKTQNQAPQAAEIQTAADVEKVVAKWIDENPEAILASVDAMRRKAAEDQVQNAQKNIATKKAELEDSNSPSVTPQGYDVTIVEFFDYACGYCKKAHATVEALLAEDTKVRLVYKEYPILGQASLEMSQVAVAVHLIDKNAYRTVHNALMESSVRSKAAAIAIAKKAGINVAKLKATLENDMEKIAGILQANSELGRSIGINGTPGFIIGNELIPGAIDVATFKAKIAALRSKK